MWELEEGVETTRMCSPGHGRSGCLWTQQRTWERRWALCLCRYRMETVVLLGPSPRPGHDTSGDDQVPHGRRCGSSIDHP